MDALAKLDTATQMLAEARTLEDVKRIMDLAEAAKTYARAAKLGIDAQNYAAEIAIIAKRKAGEFLAQLERGEAGRPEKNTPNIGSISPYSQALTSAEITSQDASRWQKMASVPEETFREYVETVKKSGDELTASGVLREAQRVKRDMMFSEKNAAPLPSDKYRVVYADPPWKYNDSGVITDTDSYGRAERHYPTMTIDELCALPIKEMVEDNAVLFLWATSPLLQDAFTVIEYWGFRYKTSFVWDKVKHNFGHYNSVRHEFLLICTRGSCTPDNLQLFDSVQSIERSETHSQKPDEFRKIIDTLYTHGKKIELFARRPAGGWDIWGNENV